MNKTASSTPSPVASSATTTPTPRTELAQLTLGYEVAAVQVQKVALGGWRVVTKEMTAVPCGKIGFLDTPDGNRSEVLVVFGEILDDGVVELCLKRVGETRKRTAPPPYSISKTWAATSLIVGLAVGIQLPIAKWLAQLIK